MLAQVLIHVYEYILLDDAVYRSNQCLLKQGHHRAPPCAAAVVNSKMCLIAFVGYKHAADNDNHALHHMKCNKEGSRLTDIPCYCPGCEWPCFGARACVPSIELGERHSSYSSSVRLWKPTTAQPTSTTQTRLYQSPAAVGLQHASSKQLRCNVTKQLAATSCTHISTA